MVAKPIGGQAAFDQVEAGLAAGNKIDDPAPIIAPITWAMMYGITSEAGKRRPTHRPMETAGFK